MNTARLRSQAAWVLLVLFMTLAARWLMWETYQPVPYGDTGSYRRLASRVEDGWQRYDGTRTPGYPAFLAVVGGDRAVWIAQMGLGVAISLFYMLIGWEVTGRAWFGALAGLAHTLNFGQLFFEANLLTETLTTFWVSATLLGNVRWLSRPASRSPLLAATLGVTASLAWLTRPLFIFLPFWTALFLGVSHQDRRIRIQWHPALAVLLPALVLLGSWVGFLHERFRTWGLTTMTGYNLIQHTGHYFELVPDEHSALRDTYLKYRDERIVQYGTQTNAIWDAIPEMQAATGMNFYRLSRTLTAVSLQLIWEHPTRYLRNVIEGWFLFWRAPVYWSPEAVRTPSMIPALRALVPIQRVGLVAANLLFVASTALAAGFSRIRAFLRVPGALWFLASTVWLASVIQTLVDHGDNPRFLIPLQSAVVLWSLWVLLRVAEGWRSRRAGGVTP